MMKYADLFNVLQHIGKDPSRLIFEDELTGIHNRRFLHNYFQYKVAWDTLNDNPLSLIMVDVDHFKQINDTYGHNIGDQTLIWFAGLLKKVAGQENFPIRYAGDEFLILLPGAGKEEALQMGERLLQQVREDPLRLDEINVTLPIGLSIGIGSAPEDAQSGKILIRKADTALYYAKKKGRNRIANAGEISPQDVFDKTAVDSLQWPKFVGRGVHLARVAECLKKFSRGQSQFLIVEGVAGIGKSTFLETIRSNLAQSKIIWQVKVNGTPQEMFRPYYLATSILVELLNQRQDKGSGILENLSTKEMAYLAQILLQLAETQEVSQGEDERQLRQGIFDTLVHLIPKIVDFRPLILFIDDIHFSDEATLIVLRQLMLGQEIPLFICSSAADTKQSEVQEEVVPLERFYEYHHQEVGIDKIVLPPLTANDVMDYLRAVFPRASFPENFGNALTRISHGNPLFLAEILRKLALEGKITLVGDQWFVQPLEEGYLPKSLEEIVTQKIAALDEESRQLLHWASMFGEEVSLSVLTGGSEKMEAQVLEFVDQAVAQGLISSEFQLNDEMIRFFGKRILEIVYGTIRKDQKQHLHERIGNYQETLYQQRLLPSAATLAYHFQRSSNQEKARNYERLRRSYDSKTFNASEAIYYTVRRQREVSPPGTPLDPSSVEQIPTVIRYFLTAVRSSRLYPQGSNTIVSTRRHLKEAIDQILARNEHLIILQINQALIVNSQRIDVTELKSIAESLVHFLNRLELKGIAFNRGLSERELEVLLEAFGRTRPEMINRSFWERFSTEHKLKHIELQQVRYAIRIESVEQAGKTETAGVVDRTSPAVASARLLAGEQKLDRDDVLRISTIIRCLLGAARSIRLYPMKGKTVANSIEQLLQALRTFLTRKKVLSLARVSDSMVVNGVRVDTSDFTALADSFLKFLDSVMLRSLTFLEHVSAEELQTFIRALGRLPVGSLDSDFWARFGKDHKLTGLLFDQVLYDTVVSPLSVASDEEQPVEETSEAIYETLPPEPNMEQLSKTLREAVPSRVSDLLLKGDEKQAHEMISRLFQDFENLPLEIKRKIVYVCKVIWNNLTLSLRHHFAKLMRHQLLDTFAGEEDPLILREIASLLHRMASNFIQFAEYPLASQIFSHLHRSDRQLQQHKTEHSQLLPKILNERLEPTVQKIIVQDLKSGEPARQKNAAQLLASLGKATTRLLIDTIKREEDLRVRQIAASLLAESGTTEAELLKRELVLGGTPEERRRILEVIDTVVDDLKPELAFVLADDNPAVRQAAFQLAERLNNDQVIKLLLNYVNSEDVELAVAAIECLGKLKPTDVVEILASVLHSAKDPIRLVACYQALGQIAHPASIGTLAKMLAPRRFLFFRKKPHATVRAAAAYALGKINHPRVVDVLEPLANDTDPRVREIARTLVRNNTRPSPAKSN